MASCLLDVEHLSVELTVDGRPRPVLHDVSFQVAAGEALGIVGESGSGKTMTVRSIMRLLPDGAVAKGVLKFGGANVAELSGAALREYRTTGIGVVFQNPIAHINPVRTIGDYLTEVVTRNLGESKARATDRVVGLLEDVGIADGPRRMRQYPHELSGGLLQRVMIAGALAPGPQLLLADEPTTALDVTTQSEVVAVLDDERRARDMAMIFITHNLDLAAAICDRIAVMYAGSIIEEQDATTLSMRPLHPYTAALMRSRLSLERRRPLEPIPGQPIAPWDATHGCPFAPRCKFAVDKCSADRPPLQGVPGHRVACHRAGELEETMIADASHDLPLR